MNGKRGDKPAWRVLRGGLVLEWCPGGLEIVAAPAGRAPFPVDAEVVEEDRYFVLSAAPVVRDVDEHVVRLMTEAAAARPAEPGSVSVRRGQPMKILAVVHDLDREPTWREEWVESALREAFREMERRQWRSAALPLIGTLHGGLAPRRFAELLVRVLGGTSAGALRRLWIVVSSETGAEVLRTLERARDS